MRTAAPTIGGLGCVLVLATCGGSDPIDPSAVAGASSDPVKAAGSGEGQPAPSEAACRPTSGSRLRARYLRAADGTEVFLGWYDKKLETPCRFRRAADGHLRCVPAAAQIIGEYYSDPACTQRAQRGDECGGEPDFVAKYAGPPGCGDDRLEVYPLGDPKSPDPDSYSLSRGRCENAGIGGGDGALRDIKPAMAPTELVGARQESGLAGRITVPVLVGDDGSRQPCAVPRQSLVDRERQEACIPWTTAGSDQLQCLPAEFAGADTLELTFGDPMCRSPRYTSATAPGCREPRYFLSFMSRKPNPMCEALTVTTSVSMAKPAASPNFTAFPGTGSCLETAAKPGEKYWDPGEPIPRAAFAEGAEVSAAAAGRLRARYHELPGGQRLFRDSFEDTKLQIVCAPAPAADGKTRCMPPPVSRTVYGILRLFKDAACTEAARVVPVDHCTGATIVMAAEGPKWCALRFRAVRVGPATAALFEKQGTACVPFSGFARPNNGFNILGDEIPLEDMAELSETVE